MVEHPPAPPLNDRQLISALAEVQRGCSELAMAFLIVDRPTQSQKYAKAIQLIEQGLKHFR